VLAFDTWVALKLHKFCQKSPSHKAYVAFLCSEASVAICDTNLYPHASKFHFDFPILSPVSLSWQALFDEMQLPRVRACVLNEEIQMSGVWLCIHFLVQNAVVDGTLRFTANHGRQKLRSWLSKRKTCTSLKSYRGKRQTNCPRNLPFCAMLALAVPFGERSTRRSKVDWVLSTVLEALPCLLVHTPPSPPIIFALRMAASLICTRRKYDSLWQELRGAIKRYLVGNAGLKNSRSGLGFVRTSNIYRFQGWRQLA